MNSTSDNRQNPDTNDTSRFKDELHRFVRKLLMDYNRDQNNDLKPRKREFRRSNTSL